MFLGSLFFVILGNFETIIKYFEGFSPSPRPRLLSLRLHSFHSPNRMLQNVIFHGGFGSKSGFYSNLFTNRSCLSSVQHFTWSSSSNPSMQRSSLFLNSFLGSTPSKGSKWYDMIHGGHDFYKLWDQVGKFTQLKNNSKIQQVLRNINQTLTNPGYLRL